VLAGLSKGQCILSREDRIEDGSDDQQIFSNSRDFAGS